MDSTADPLSDALRQEITDRWISEIRRRINRLKGGGSEEPMVAMGSLDGVEVRYVGKSRMPYPFQPEDDPTLYVSYWERKPSGRWGITQRMSAEEFDVRVANGEFMLFNPEAYELDRSKVS